MSERKAILAVLLLLAMFVLGPAALAQEPATPEPDSDDQAPAEPVPTQAEEKKKKHFGLFVQAGYGKAESDAFNATIVTDATRVGFGEFEVDEQSLSKAAIGWKLRENKGAYRLVFNGFKEESYKFAGIGAQNLILGIPGTINNSCTAEDLKGVEGAGTFPGYSTSPTGGRCLYNWWGVTVDNGLLTSIRVPGEWNDPPDDANGNQVADPGEINFLEPNRVVQYAYPDDMQNRLQTWDALYGREFGGRRFSSKWWAGLRYFKYDGNMLAAAWLNVQSAPGVGFTDGDVLRLLNIRQEASGFGPTGSWEANFNFFNKGLVLYVRGQVAFTFNSLEADTGDFFTLVPDGNNGTLSAEAYLNHSREKSSWQNTGEVGVRVNFAFGLELELAYTLSGYLDVVLLPSSITIPTIPAQANQGTSALYQTQDFRTSSTSISVGFQF